MKHLAFFLCFFPAVSFARYIKAPGGYMMVLRQGDNVFSQLENFMTKEKIKSATFTGMGFVNAKFGYFNFETKEFEPKEFKKVELASFNGSLAWEKEKPSVHAHGVVSGKDFQAYGGHLLEATVDTGSLEIRIHTLDKKLQRSKDETIGANVLRVEEK